MTDRLFDELARSLARPVPRRSALRLLGGALVAAALPALRPSPARALALDDDPCPTCADRPGTLPCCVRLSATTARVAVGQCYSVAKEQCCVGASAYDGKPTAWICAKGQTCGADGERLCLGCPTGQAACGSICCDEGAVCADPDLEYCCGPRETACRGGKTVSCCRPGERCCAGKCCPSGSGACCKGTCCGPGQRCDRGRCKPCPAKERPCGSTCCGKGETCCGSRCCEKGETCCDGTCCAKGGTCCGDHCCEKPRTCCGDGCCAAGTTCVTRAGKSACCPNARTLSTPGGKVCCERGYVASGDRCCPANAPAGSCRDCSDTPCPAGQFCEDGYCVQA